MIGGGWAPFLYYRYHVDNRDHAPVLTSDIDFMVKHHVPTIGPKTINELLTRANLKAKFKTLDTPPIIHYEGTIEGVDEPQVAVVERHAGHRRWAGTSEGADEAPIVELE